MPNYLLIFFRKGFALRGYTSSHKDLYKPEGRGLEEEKGIEFLFFFLCLFILEMSKEWQKQHNISATQSYEADLQNTDLMLHFKYYLSQLKKAIPG